MQYIINLFFPDQIIAIYLMAGVMFFLGVGGGALVVYRSLFKGESGIAWSCAVVLFAVIASYATYVNTMAIFDHNLSLIEDPSKLETYRALGVEQRPLYDSTKVYEYGAEDPVTLAEHQSRLAASAATSSGDPE